MINSCFLSLFLITLLIYLIITDNFFKANNVTENYCYIEKSMIISGHFDRNAQRKISISPWPTD